MNVLITIENPNVAQYDLIRLISVEDDIKKDKQDTKITELIEKTVKNTIFKNEAQEEEIKP